MPTDHSLAPRSAGQDVQNQDVRNQDLQNGVIEKRPLPLAAERALAEAAARRAERERESVGAPAEVGGRLGPDPTRYGDWEVNGLSSDF